MGRRHLATRLLATSCCLGVAWGVVAHETSQLPEGAAAAEGLTVHGVRANGELTAEELVVRSRDRLLRRRVRVVHDQRVVLETSLAELGATVETKHLVEAVRATGRSGNAARRLAEARRARAHELAAHLEVALPLEALVERLATTKEELDERPRAARLDFKREEARPHQEGRLVDVDATLAAILDAAHDTTDASMEVPLVLAAVVPTATSARVAAIDRSAVLARFETRYGAAGSEAGRATNVARAAEGIDGAALFPGEVVSFNDLVGPRSTDNGFEQAGEIYKGEMRLGVGGGTCQVASTLHAAAFFGGLDVVTRSPHSRPSAYIRMGLDATVVYPDVDLRLRNPYDFPLIVRAEARAGVLTVELLGRERRVEVALDTVTVGERRFGRKVERAGFLPPGKIVRKQGGRRGVVLEKRRTLRYFDGHSLVETTRDVYPPTTEIYLLGPEADEATLPPLDEPSEPASAELTSR